VVISKSRPVGASSTAAPSRVTELALEVAKAPEKVLSTPAKAPEKESAEAAGEESHTTLASTVSSKVFETQADWSGDCSTEATQAPVPDVIHIEDEPEEFGKEVQKSVKRKGKEKVPGSSKRARFATDPTEYALTRVSEAKLLFGRLHFILRTIPVTQQVRAKLVLLDSFTTATPIIAELSSQSSVGKTKAILEPEAGLISGVHPPAEIEISLESEAKDLPEPVGDGSTSNLVRNP